MGFHLIVPYSCNLMGTIVKCAYASDIMHPVAHKPLLQSEREDECVGKDAWWARLKLIYFCLGNNDR